MLGGYLPKPSVDTYTLAMMQTQPQRAGIYCRLSYAPDGSLEKVERQEADCRQLAERLGWPVSESHIFPDNSRSAWQRNRKRPQWDLMLRAIEAREIDAVIVYHGDRLIRQPHDLETLISIADSKGVRIASPSGTRDLDSPDDRFILRIEAAQACRESDNTSRRVRRALAARRDKGLTQAGGRRPFGYGVQIGTRTKLDPETRAKTEVPLYDTTVQVPKEAKILKEAAERLLAGQGQAGVIRWLDTKCTTTEGNPWSAKALRNLMLSARVAGLIEHNGQLYEAAWEGILSREVWEDMRALYEASAKENPYAGRARRYLLSGTGGAECGLCGHTMATKPSGGRNRKTSRIYYCPGCKKVGRSVAHLDAYVEGRAIHLLNDPRYIEELAASATADDGGTVAEIAELERRRRKLKEQLEHLADHPEVDAALALAAVASFDQKITALRARMVDTSHVRQISRMIGIRKEQWADTPLDIRSATVRGLFQITVLPTRQRGPGFDTSSVRVERRKPEGRG